MWTLIFSFLWMIKIYISVISVFCSYSVYAFILCMRINKLIEYCSNQRITKFDFYTSQFVPVFVAPPTPTFPDQYGTIIEANIVEQKLTVTAEEYFDRPGNRAVLQMRQNNTLHNLVFDYQNDQLFYVQGLLAVFVFLISFVSITYSRN